MTEATKTAAKKTEIFPVKMDDGSIVDFTGKKQLIKTSTIADGKVTIRLDWRNGEFRVFEVPAALLLKFAAHGAEQKLGDEIAGLKGENGAEADIEDKVMAVDNLIDRLNSGEWSTRRESDGMAGTSILHRALCLVYNQKPEAIREYLRGLTAAQKKALRASPKLAPTIAELEAQRRTRAPQIDAGALLDGLESQLGLGSEEAGEADTAEA